MLCLREEQRDGHDVRKTRTRKDLTTKGRDWSLSRLPRYHTTETQKGQETEREQRDYQSVV